MIGSYYKALLGLAPTTIVPVIPEVWVSETSAYNASNDRMEITWRLSISQPLAQTLYVNVYHSDIADGQIETYIWDIPAGQTSVAAMYYYPTANTTTVSELVLGVSPGGTYTIPDTPERPQQVIVAKQVGSGSGGGTGGTAPDPLGLTWENRITPDSSQVVNGVLTITGRNLDSTDGEPVIDLRYLPDYTEIRIEGNNLRGYGAIAFSEYARHRIIIRNNFIFDGGQYLENTTWGRFVYTGANPLYVLIENNTIEGFGAGGEYSPVPTQKQLDEGYVDPVPECEGYVVRYNTFKNITGDSAAGRYANCFNIQGNDRNVPNIVFEWNQIINEEGVADVEDNINLFSIGGTATSRMKVRHNFLRGAYSKGVLGGYSGGGFICEQQTEGAETNYDVHDNMICHVKNYAVGIAGGRNIYIYNNKIIVAGQYDDGSYFDANSSGIWAKDYYETGSTNIHIYNNTVGVRNTGNTQDTSDDYHEEINNIGGVATVGSNTTWGAMGWGFPTLSDEEALFTEWQNKLSTNNITLGVLAA